MKCWYCKAPVQWQSDFTFEDYEMSGDGIVTVLTCTGCNAYYEITLADDPVKSSKQIKKTNKENE